MGVALTSLLHARQSSRQVDEARRDRRREDFIVTAAELTSSLAALIQAEYDRAKRRLEGEVGEAREQARQRVYDRRTEARTALYRLKIVGDLVKDAPLLASADAVIKSSREVSFGTSSIAAVNDKNRLAKEALDRFASEANRRVGQL
jgi:hypothetical protein